MIYLIIFAITFIMFIKNPTRLWVNILLGLSINEISFQLLGVHPLPILIMVAIIWYGIRQKKLKGTAIKE